MTASDGQSERPELSPDDRREVFELYKLSVEMADRVTGRRASANSFFLTLHTALVTIVGLLSAAEENIIGAAAPTVDRVAVAATGVAGCVLAISWYILLRSYRDLNRAKFDVINQIEHDHLPIEPFASEWRSLKKDPVKRWRPRYAELGFVERSVPVVFLAIYLGLIARTFF